VDCGGADGLGVVTTAGVDVGGLYTELDAYDVVPEMTAAVHFRSVQQTILPELPRRTQILPASQ
jgi:hypothetical protein